MPESVLFLISLKAVFSKRRRQSQVTCYTNVIPSCKYICFMILYLHTHVNEEMI